MTNVNGGNLSVPMLHRKLRERGDAHDVGQFPNSQKIDVDDAVNI